MSNLFNEVPKSFSIVGFGSSLILTTIFWLIPQYFRKNKGKANSIIYCGTSAGSLLFSLTYVPLHEEYGFRGLILIISAISLHLFVTALICKSPLKEIQINEVAVEQGRCRTTKRVLTPICRLDLYVLKNINFTFFSALAISLFMTNEIFNIFLEGLCKEKGLSKSAVSYILIISSLAGIFSRFISGFLIDIKCIRDRRCIPYCVVTMIYSVGVILLPLIDDKTVLFVTIVTLLTVNNGISTQRNTVMSDLVSKEKLSDALGINRFFSGIGLLISLTCGGRIKDVSGSYGYTYIIAGSLLLFTSVVYIFQYFLRYEFKKKQRNFLTST